jgi:hypothetical protein
MADPNYAALGANEGTDVSRLLMKEQEEINSWGRTSLQIYFAWYCAFLTANGAGLGLFLATNHSSIVAFAVFALWNFLGVLVSWFVSDYVKDSNARIVEIYKNLGGEAKDSSLARSPLPSRLARSAIGIDSFSMAVLGIVWLILCIRAVH